MRSSRVCGCLVTMVFAPFYGIRARATRIKNTSRTLAGNLYREHLENQSVTRDGIPDLKRHGSWHRRLIMCRAMKAARRSAPRRPPFGKTESHSLGPDSDAIKGPFRERKRTRGSLQRRRFTRTWPAVGGKNRTAAYPTDFRYAIRFERTTKRTRLLRTARWTGKRASEG